MISTETQSNFELQYCTFTENQVGLCMVLHLRRYCAPRKPRCSGLGLVTAASKHCTPLSQTDQIHNDADCVSCELQISTWIKHNLLA